jgi:uncharacterized membrane protein
MNPNDLAVATYDTHLKAEQAVKSLQRAGFDMRRISIIARDYSTDEQVLGFFNAGDRARFFGKFGAFWGGLFGLLFGAAFLFVPVVGHIVVFGPLAATIVGGLEGAAVGGGVSALLGALSAIGVPRNSVLRYATAIRADQFLLVVHGDASEIQRARDLLAQTDANSIDLHSAGSETTAEAHG